MNVYIFKVNENYSIYVYHGAQNTDVQREPRNSNEFADETSL